LARSRPIGRKHVRTLIENSTVVTATQIVESDVVIEDERVAAIGLNLGVTNVHDA
jgi:dihydroorotase-like cyclic amidohydrolase